MRNLKKNLILIVDEDQSQSIPQNLNGYRVLQYSTTTDNELFIEQLSEYAASLVPSLSSAGDNEPNRLLRKNEYDAAVISVFRLLESSLRPYNSMFVKGTTRLMPVPLSQMLKYLSKSNLPQNLVSKLCKHRAKKINL